MNILQLISSEGYYGAESMLLSLARALPELGCGSMVGVFRDSRRPDGGLETKAAQHGLQVATVPCAGRWDWSAVRRIRELLEVHKIDVLHTHGYKADIYGYAAAWPHRVALVATCHNWPSRLLSMRAYAALDRLMLRRFDRVATASGPVAESLTRWKMPPHKLKIIPNGVDMEPFRDPAPSGRAEVGSGGERRVGFVGRLVPDKGGAVLLTAAQAVLAVFPHARFIFAGEGPARAEWEALAAKLEIASKVVFAGRRDDMPALYASLDMVVLPSLQEAMPMCLLEALAAARAVVATSVGAIPKVVIPGVTGLLCEPGDSKALSQAILRLLRDPELGRTMGQHGRAHVARNFAAEVVGRGYVGLYHEALGGHRRSISVPAESAEPRMHAADDLQLSIIVACRNEKAHIRQFMDSLLRQDMTGITWEAIIADGMSSDGTREILRDYAGRHPEVRSIDNPRQVVSPGLNAAIRAARGSIVIRMDAHTFYAPDYCRTCLRELERTGADNVGGPARTRTEGTRARAFAAAYHSPFSTGARFHDENYEGWIDTVPYGCWRKETLERLGLFDETLVRNQDDELNLRLIRAGGKIWQSPDIVSWYSPRASLKALFLQYFQYGFWKAAVIRKHRVPGSWRHLIPVTFVLAHIVLFAACLVTAAAGHGELLVAGGLWLALVLAYAAANVTASVAAARKSGWATLAYLPAVFTVYHFSWGLGFLAGVRWFLPHAAQSATNNTVFTRISR